MKLIRIVLSDLHLGTGSRRGELNPLEDFPHDDRFADLLQHYDTLAGDSAEIELIFNGDIFDLLKVPLEGHWPVEVSAEVAAKKLHRCLEGHPRFVRALRQFLERPSRRLTYLPGNHDLDMWFSAPQELFLRYVAPGKAGERVRFITNSDTYYLPEGIQIRHGHQLERIHRVDYQRMTRKRRDGTEVLNLPWGSLWILEVMNPAKLERSYVDRIQPLRRFLFGALLFDTLFAFRFMARTAWYFMRWRVFTMRAWGERLRGFRALLKEEVFALGGYDEAAVRSIQNMRGAHTLIVGHSHGPRYRQLKDGKILVNTGTWMQMVNLDLRYLGRDSGLTYALIEYDDQGQPQTTLMRWNGSQTPCDPVAYAD